MEVVKRSWTNNKLLHIAIIIRATVLAYSKVFQAGFMSWDDMEYVFQTKDIQSIDWSTITHWFTKYYIGNYQPLPVATYALDYLMNGAHPLAFHIDSLIWHVADVILLYIFLQKIQPNVWVSFIVALLFALHPTQTESVSWIAARNKVMNAFFMFSALNMYVTYVRAKHVKYLVGVCLAGFAAYLCKATAVALPLALLAVDIWLGRSLKGSKVWLEKLPLVILSLPIIYMTLHAQQDVNFLEVHHEFGWGERIAFAGYAYTQYIVQLLFPVKLSVLYPYPKGVEPIHIVYTVIALGIAALTYISYRRKWNILCGGLFFYTFNILPVLQFIQFGEVLMADRYLYVASVGIWLPLVYYTYQFLVEKSRVVVYVATAAIPLFFLAMTYQRNDIWMSEMNFWEAIVEKFPHSSVAQNSMGGVYMKEGNYIQAAPFIEQAIADYNKNYKAWYNKGVLLLRTGNAAEAVKAFDACVAIKEYNKALFSRAMAYDLLHQPRATLQDIEKVLQQQPDNARAYYLQGSSYEQLQDWPQAMNSYTKAIELQGNEPLYYLRRGILNANNNRNNEALADLTTTINMTPEKAEAWYWRGMVKSGMGQEPCPDLQMAIKRGSKEAVLAAQKLCNTTH